MHLRAAYFPRETADELSTLALCGLTVALGSRPSSSMQSCGERRNKPRWQARVSTMHQVNK